MIFHRNCEVILRLKSFVRRNPSSLVKLAVGENYNRECSHVMFIGCSTPDPSDRPRTLHFNNQHAGVESVLSSSQLHSGPGDITSSCFAVTLVNLESVNLNHCCPDMKLFDY